MEETMVVIVGAGPAGLATSACLNRLSIPNIVLEREDCYGSLWKKRSYDRLKLHLAKQFCHLPYMDFPPNAPTYVPKKGFIDYLDNYVSHFGITPRYLRSVESVIYDSDAEKWQIVVKNMTTTDNVIETEVYTSRFLVVASGENSQGTIPDIDGLDSYGGEYIHSNQYENGRKFRGKDVLVVGCGNSGMEIAYDLWNWGANTSIVVRNPVHVLTKEMVKMAMIMSQYLPCKAVDKITVAISRLKYGKLTKYGIRMPTKGPFHLKETTGRSPVIDVGTISKIKSGEIKVLPGMEYIKDNEVVFTNGATVQFDAIVFATGYKSTVRNWLKGSYESFDEKGMPKKSFPYHWKGGNGIYNAGFSRRGLQGISSDAQNIANDIYTKHTAALS
ncbi:putative indole-3-pyruvate monooxygenase YUCCA11 [Gossypium australe]|uniref:Flavin-containing monooxygenase n=1 Tax=Gossypium australe TaxID=47621 RepID=A0A5B6WF47_9ROSI|nr:putative indole-3-pyruvate monooxygenase YUCCA11 [Gossypium australe]